jgi:hypothetical protein
MPSRGEIDAERKRVRRLQFMMSMVMNVISQDEKMPVEEASELIASARRAALTMFPGKELAYDLIYRPRFQRLLTEKYNMQ